MARGEEQKPITKEYMKNYAEIFKKKDKQRKEGESNGE